MLGPIFTRELVVAPRRPQHFVIRTVYVTAIFVLMCTAWLVMAGTQIVRNVGDMARFGTILFQILAPLQLALVTFLAALTAASSVSQEKDKQTLVLLLMTRLTNREVVLGKMVAAILNVLAMLLAALPVFLLITLFGGVSLPQVGWAFGVTLVTALAAASLGSTVALWRDKTFQSLAVTALVLVMYLGIWEAVAAIGAHTTLGGISLTELATAASPIRAILAAAQPYGNRAIAGWPSEAVFCVVALLVAAGLNGLAIWRLRIWNPGREIQPGQQASEEPSPAASSQPQTDAAARARHVDARVRSVSFESRQVWDNPVLWREMCTWAYGRKVLVIRLAYLLLFLLATFGLYSTIASGAALARASQQAIVPAAAATLAPFFLVSLVIVNALAVVSITNERDGGSLDLLLVTDLSPKEFVFGKIGGVAYVTKEMILLPLALVGYLWWASGLSGENLFFVVVGLIVMNVFVIVLGIHCGLMYANSRRAIGVSLGTVFFLFLGVVTLILLMISFSGSFQTQLAPFLAFVLGGGVGLYVTLGIRNPSPAIGLASLLLPFATFFAITSFLLGHNFQVWLVTIVTYGFTTAAMLIPAIFEFDIAMGRTKAAGEE